MTRSPRLKQDDLLELIEKIAHHHHDGHFLIVKAKTGYKVVFGAVDGIEKQVPILQLIDDDLFLADALHLALILHPETNDSRTLEEDF